MKARVIHTKFWTDSYIGTLSVTEKLLFIYLFTNELVNIINLYEISERKIIFDTGLTPDQFSKAIHKFTTDNKIGYRYGYVYLYNGFKYQNYVGEKNEEAKNKLIQALSEDLRNWYYTPMYTPINTPLIGTSNKKSLINNKKLEINNNSNNKDSNNTVIVTEPVEYGDKDINTLIDLFETHFSLKLPEKKKNRHAAHRLIMSHGIEKVMKAAQFALSLQGEEYAPRVTSIIDLEKKLIDLSVIAKKRGNKSSNLVVIS